MLYFHTRTPHITSRRQAPIGLQSSLPSSHLFSTAYENQSLNNSQQQHIKFLNKCKVYGLSAVRASINQPTQFASPVVQYFLE